MHNFRNNFSIRQIFTFISLLSSAETTLVAPASQTPEQYGKVCLSFRWLITGKKIVMQSTADSHEKQASTANKRRSCRVVGVYALTANQLPTPSYTHRKGTKLMIDDVSKQLTHTPHHPIIPYNNS